MKERKRLSPRMDMGALEESQDAATLAIEDDAAEDHVQDDMTPVPSTPIVTPAPDDDMTAIGDSTTTGAGSKGTTGKK